ncbi:MAG TPA: DNA polymerase IV, partial [Roseiflexaceae bacterium]|nr:DNA polymerase IV [Roseiflexaceae bacterium]
EAFLDVSTLAQDGAELAARIQATIRNELGLPCSLGVAGNKLVAKIATDVGKGATRGAGSPNAICVVPAGQEAAFLAPLPTNALWGVGPKTAERLAGMGIHTIGEIAAWPEADLARRFGKHGHDLARHARGIDDRPIVTSHAAKSISQESTFAQDVRDADSLRQTIETQAADIGRKLKRDGLVCTTVKLKLRWPDFTTLTRQATLQDPTDQAGAIAEIALRLFDQVWRSGRPVRLLGVGVSGLGAPPRQLSLWDVAPADSDQQRRIQAALAALRERFGTGIVRRASDL